MFLWEIPVHNFTFSFQCKQTFYSRVLVWSGKLHHFLQHHILPCMSNTETVLFDIIHSGPFICDFAVKVDIVTTSIQKIASYRDRNVVNMHLDLLCLYEFPELFVPFLLLSSSSKCAASDGCTSCACSGKKAPVPSRVRGERLLVWGLLVLQPISLGFFLCCCSVFTLCLLEVLI